MLMSESFCDTTESNSVLRSVGTTHLGAAHASLALDHLSSSSGQVWVLLL